MKRASVLLIWFPATILTFLFSFLLLNSYTKVKSARTLVKIQANNMIKESPYQFFAALPQVLGSFNVAVNTGDARPEILKKFFKSYDSPLEPYSQKIVSASDDYGIDYRLITSIAMCESNVGKAMPKNSHNAWGYAVYTGEESGAVFKDWNHAIDVMAEYLYNKYYKEGLATPDEIGPIYAPPSVENGNSWARCVTKFMEELI